MRLTAGEAGSSAEALTLVERCLVLEPGWVPARGVRAVLLADGGRAREAQAEVDALKQLGAGAADVLAEFAARCDATLAATEAVHDAERPRAGRVGGGRARPTQASRESPPDGEAGRGASTHWIDVLEGGRLRGRVRLG